MEYQARPQYEQVPFHNPNNLLLFSKIHSQLDGELNVLRNQAKNQQRMMQLNLEKLSMEANKVRFENYDAFQNFDTYNSYRKATLMDQYPSMDKPTTSKSFISAGQNIMQTHKSTHNDRSFTYDQYQPVKQIQTGSVMFPINDRSTLTSFVPSQPSTSVATYDEQDRSFVDLMEIEKLNERLENDMIKYQLQTEKRYNTEKLLQELEMNKEFPDLSTRIEIEKKYIIDKSKLDRKLEANDFNGHKKDLVYQLIEQSNEHNELDKIR